jgi:Spy/CpxP family protein refolding chaperone
MGRNSWWKRMGLVATAVAAVVVLGGAAGKRMHGMHDPARMEAWFGKKLDKLLDEVKATPEQRQQIVAIKDELVAKRRAAREAHRADHAELIAQWESANPDMNKIHARIDDRAKEHTAFAHEAADALAKVHAILTPEQRTQVAAKIREHHERRGGKHPER